jgi:two-component system LytT family sensor kinase
LEKIRYSDPNYIEFNVSGENLDALIPPFILMPFVENAFKHGDKMKPAPGVKINLEVNKSGIDFEINNYVKEGTDINKKNGGFGLNNIRRRLDLLFDKKYRLEINSEKKIFSVKLNLTYI